MWVKACRLSLPLNGRGIDAHNDITKGLAELSCVVLAHPHCEDEQNEMEGKIGL